MIQLLNFRKMVEKFYKEPNKKANVWIPMLDNLAQVINVCDPETCEVIGTNKPTWRIYEYNFDLHFPFSLSLLLHEVKQIGIC